MTVYTAPYPMRALFALGLVAALAGCATIEEAYGRPDPLDWTYFHGDAQDVVTALQETFTQSGLSVESVYEEAGGVVLTLSRRGRADFAQVLVQSTDVEGFTARAQVYPDGDPLPRWLEMEVSGRI